MEATFFGSAAEMRTWSEANHAAGRLSLDAALTGLRRFQRFLDTHLNRRNEAILDSPDFPPAAIAHLRKIPWMV